MEDTLTTGTVCANIGPKERAARMRVGWLGTAIALLALGGLLEAHASNWMRLLIGLPIFIASMGFFQATAKTCVAFARKGIRVLGDSRAAAEKVEDDGMKKQIAKQARRVYLNAVIATVVTVGLVLLLP